MLPIDFDNAGEENSARFSASLFFSRGLWGASSNVTRRVGRRVVGGLFPRPPARVLDSADLLFHYRRNSSPTVVVDKEVLVDALTFPAPQPSARQNIAATCGRRRDMRCEVLGCRIDRRYIKRKSSVRAEEPPRVRLWGSLGLGLD